MAPVLEGSLGLLCETRPSRVGWQELGFGWKWLDQAGSRGEDEAGSVPWWPWEEQGEHMVSERPSH